MNTDVCRDNISLHHHFLKGTKMIIEQGIPFKPRRRAGKSLSSKIRAALSQMNVGDSLHVTRDDIPDGNLHSLTRTTAHRASVGKLKFETRKTGEDSVRIFRTA